MTDFLTAIAALYVIMSVGRSVRHKRVLTIVLRSKTLKMCHIVACSMYSTGEWWGTRDGGSRFSIDNYLLATIVDSRLGM